VGFGLLFAAPLTGIGTSRLMGAHVRNPQYGVAVWTCLFVLGLSQARAVYSTWPNSTGVVSVLAPLVSPKGHYLASAPQVMFYQLGLDRTSPDQWTSTSGFTRPDRIAAGEFDLVVLDDQVEPRTNAVITETLRSSPRYRLRALLPYSHGKSLGSYEIWVKYQ
jgi:hypothetical protein